jgi:hypothetical protein
MYQEYPSSVIAGIKRGCSWANNHATSHQLRHARALRRRWASQWDELCAHVNRPGFSGAELLCFIFDVPYVSGRMTVRKESRTFWRRFLRNDLKRLGDPGFVFAFIEAALTGIPNPGFGRKQPL